jgi:diadenosine tetraphosphate (Ap4A) HIT family hydrolase
MMTNNKNVCVFCENEFASRTICKSPLIASFVSRPWFRGNHCLVIPNRHITKPSELTREESAEIMQEIGRLSEALDNGFGTGIMQKYQPLQTENGIKVNHLHFHVFPRVKNEPTLFPVPEPNGFEGFFLPTVSDIDATLKKTKTR